MLFVLANINKTQKLKACITVGSREIKITQYTDDTTVFLKIPQIDKFLAGAPRKVCKMLKAKN